jgi:LacI family transcriptional regulator
VPISDQTRQKVLETARKLGYQPSVLARNLKSGTSMTIGFLMPTFGNPYYWDILNGAESEITRHGYNLALVVSNLNPNREAQLLLSLHQQLLDGLIIMPSFPDLYIEELDKLKKSTTPIIFTMPMDNANWVFPDIRHGADLMMDHLISLGHRRIGLINGVARLNLAQERLDAYHEKLEAAGISIDDRLVQCCGNTSQDAYLETLALLDLPNRPTAIWAINDVLAIGVLRAVHECGLRIPQDIAVAGFDDIVYAAQMYPPLTTVQQPRFELGQRAAQILFTRLEAPNSPLIQETLPTRLIIRQSTVCQA